VEKINIGQSGADLYAVDNQYVVKHVMRNKLENQELFLSFKKEAHFYQSMDRTKLPCLPEVLSIRETDDEILLCMKKYRRVEHHNVNQTVLSKIMKAIALVHHCQAPPFLSLNPSDIKLLSDEEIMHCVNGWNSVLREHQGRFDAKPIETIAKRINSMIRWHASGEANLIHGDFHLHNLLLDDEENIVICDWQSVSIGNAANDLGFFLSRFNADGFQLSERALIDLYSNAVYELYGKRADSEVIYSHLSASTLITSFRFWHEYLHGASEEKVGKIYEKMVQMISDGSMDR
jgi:thiamine kinase-like enzyme